MSGNVFVLRDKPGAVSRTTMSSPSCTTDQLNDVRHADEQHSCPLGERHEDQTLCSAPARLLPADIHTAVAQAAQNTAAVWPHMGQPGSDVRGQQSKGMHQPQDRQTPRDMRNAPEGKHPADGPKDMKQQSDGKAPGGPAPR